jgi:hypothetical protein
MLCDEKIFVMIAPLSVTDEPGGLDGHNVILRRYQAIKA